MDHLAIPVSDQERSRNSDQTYCGFGAARPAATDGGVLTLHTAGGFALALPADSDRPPKAGTHFGMGLPDRDVVHAPPHRLVAVASRSLVLHRPEYVSVKRRDPGPGHIVEASREPRT